MTEQIKAIGNIAPFTFSGDRRAALPALPNREAEGDQQTYAIFLPQTTLTGGYSIFQACVFEPKQFNGYIGSATGDPQPGFRKVEIGKKVGTLSVPYDRGDISVAPDQRALEAFGLERLSYEESVVGVIRYDETTDPTQSEPYPVRYVDVYSLAFPEPTLGEWKNLIDNYKDHLYDLRNEPARVEHLRREKERVKNQGDEARSLITGEHEFDLRVYGTIDQRLIFPSLQELNKDTGLGFDERRSLFPKRLAALEDGYVQMGSTYFQEIPTHLITDPDIITWAQQNNKVTLNGYLLPSLARVYDMQKLARAGFYLLLTENSSGKDINSDVPSEESLAVMAKPSVII